ncbi:MAG: phosphoribosylformylglycinamidine synthase subunit PurL [Myxococcales bacterium]|nr:phosphoribosylformylglycinamidine synthase subunit PurL [Myxococcales bacterium]MCB9671263.1 phosphoribosylformylglycinamidine synthase subunit PurL [Alphaproteobacteria bacterium]
MQPVPRQVHRVEVRSREPARPLPGTTRTDVVRVFFVEGTTPREDVERLAREVLCDDVIETFAVGTADGPVVPTPAGRHVLEIAPRPGVTDAEAETLLRAAAIVGIPGVERTATARRYELEGDLAPRALERLAAGTLANDVVQHWAIDDVLPPSFPAGESPVHVVEQIRVRDLDDDGLLALSRERRLSLDLDEMRCIREHFTDRDPTDLELEMLAQTWSEHCVHKTFRAHITLTELSPAGDVLGTRTVDSMLRSFLRAATDAAARDWVRSAFVDNAGIVRFDEDFDVALKVETHNHPSALEPFGGANTGVGGVVRDILGVSARPIANTDVLCFGPPDTAELPDGVLHPTRIAAGVIAGIEDYGNKMGIPTVAGAVVYDPGYVANPLVYAGCLGILPHGSHPTEPRVGDRVVVIGGRTGRDGLRGATFSSMEMSHETHELAGTAVQIGHPIHEKQVQEVVCEARDAGLYTAITDCGAGGLSSSIGEMAQKLGAEVFLERVPTKYPGLQPWELWLSEAQERMVLAVPDASWEALQAVCERHAVEVVSLGRFTGDGVLTVRHRDTVVGRLDTHFLHDGLPQRRMQATWVVREHVPLEIALEDWEGAVLGILGSPNGRSREDVVRLYDHEVQGGTVGRPLVGEDGHGHGDGSVLVPLAARDRGRFDRGVALGCGIQPAYGTIDPYRMAWAAVDEAVRNVVVVGADPESIALVDNFCWGNPNLPDRLGALVRCGEGCRDAALALGAPYVSGKDSLNNEYATPDGSRRAIPGTLLITALGIVPDVACSTTTELKRDGDLIVVVGTCHGELGGSALARHLEQTGGEAPRPVEDLRALAGAVHAALRTGRVDTAHDVSEGGLVVALAEMCLGGRRGATVDLAKVRSDADLTAVERGFGESASMYVLAVRPEDEAVVRGALGEVPHAVVGRTGGSSLTVDDGSRDVLDVPVTLLEAAFRS